MTESLASLLPELEFDVRDTGRPARDAGNKEFPEEDYPTQTCKDLRWGYRAGYRDGARYQFDKMKSENELMRALLTMAIEQRDHWMDVADGLGCLEIDNDGLIAIMQEWKSK